MILFLLGFPLLSNATLTLSFTGGTLFGLNTESPLADGSLVIAVTTSNSSFSGPVDGSFVSGGDTVIGSWTVDSGVDGPGTFDVTFENISYGAGIDYGQKIALYWFSSISSIESLPNQGDAYGFYSDSSWLIPADGSLLVTYTISTIANGGSLSDSSTVANMVVSAVPEPAAYAGLVGVAALGVVAWRRRRAV